MDSIFNPRRLNLARRRRGLTKAALAAAIGVSARMTTAYERGEKEPGLDTLDKIAQVLRFPVAFFYAPDLDEPPVEGSSFRALSTLTASQRDQALGAGALCIALSDWIDEQFSLPDPNIPRYEGIDPETAAMAVRSEWGLGEQPIANILHLLEAQGVRVFSLALECVEVDAFSFWRGSLPYVFLNTIKTAEHRRMDAAHELGHLVLHWRGGARGRDSEQEANQFGSAFLMPRGSVLAVVPPGAQLSQIMDMKKRWNVAASNLAYRMHAVGLLSEWQYRMVFIELGRMNLRTAEKDGSAPETSQVFAQVFQMLRDDGTSRADLARQLNISLDDLNSMVFGLTLASAGARVAAILDDDLEPPQLRLL